MEDKCSYTNEEGIVINTCVDLPVTYCSKCGSFYILDREGNREDLIINQDEVEDE